MISDMTSRWHAFHLPNNRVFQDLRLNGSIVIDLVGMYLYVWLLVCAILHLPSFLYSGQKDNNPTRRFALQNRKDDWAIKSKVNKIQSKIRQKQPTNSHLICRLLAWPFALFRVRKDDKTTDDKKQIRFSTKTV